MRIVLILLLVLYAVKAHSAEDFVLFVDMNNSPQEVKAARESAEKSGRKLVVLPEIPEKERKKFIRLAEEVSAARKQFTKTCAGEKPDKAACEAKRKIYDEAEAKKSAFAEPFKLDAEKFAAFLAANKDKTFSSVVISGHDGTGSFSGEFGRIADTNIAEALGKYPAMKDSIRSLHLWGCYTTSPGSLLLNWKKHFPNTSLITGYEGRAPLGDKPAGWHYLKGVLAKEPELLRAGDSAKLQGLLKKIPGANQVTSAIYACDDYASLKDHYNIADLQHRCDDVKPQIQEKGPEFECYLKAENEKCENPPENVGSGPIRQFYELLHKASACAEITNDAVFSTYSRDTAIRLVFNSEVQKNFGRIYAKQLQEIDEMLEKFGAPDRIRFKDIGNLSRREALQRADDLLEFIDKNKNDPLQDPNNFEVNERDAQFASLKQFQQNYTQLLASLRPSCVPFNWTEPEQKEKSECIQEKWLGKDGVKTYLNPENGLRSSLLSQMSYDLTTQVEALRKANGEKPAADIQAKIVDFEAQSEKLRYHSRYEKGTLPPEYQTRIAARERYSKLVRELANKGVAHPQSDLSALRILLEINRPELEATIASIQDDLKRTEKDLNEPNLSTSDREYYASRVKSQQARIAIEQAALEATRIISSDAEWDSLTGKAEEINALKDKIGRQFRESEILEKSGNVKMYADYLKTGGLNAADTKVYQEELRKAEEELRTLQNESAAKVRLRGHEYLTTLRHKY